MDYTYVGLYVRECLDPRCGHRQVDNPPPPPELLIRLSEALRQRVLRRWRAQPCYLCNAPLSAGSGGWLKAGDWPGEFIRHPLTQGLE